jgi:hypothetical protein
MTLFRAPKAATWHMLSPVAATHSGVVEAHCGAFEAHPRAIEADPGAVLNKLQSGDAF